MSVGPWNDVYARPTAALRKLKRRLFRTQRGRCARCKTRLAEKHRRRKTASGRSIPRWKRHVFALIGEGDAAVLWCARCAAPPKPIDLSFLPKTILRKKGDSEGLPSPGPPTPQPLPVTRRQDSRGRGPKPVDPARELIRGNP